MGNQFDDTSIKSFFIIEAQEYIDVLKRSVTTEDFNPDDTKTIETIQGTAHTLKGSAAMLSFHSLSKMARYTELLMKALSAGVIEDGTNMGDLLRSTIKIMEKMVSNISFDKEEENQALIEDKIARYDRLLDKYDDEKPEDDESVADGQEENNAEKNIEEDSTPIAVTEAATFKQPIINDKESETSPEEKIIEAHEKTEQVRPKPAYSSIPTLSGESKRKTRSKRVKPEPVKKEPVAIEPAPEIKTDEPLEEIREAPKDKPIPKEITQESSPEIEKVARRQPKESDFFLPGDETYALQSEKKKDGGMSFLNMIPDIKESFILEATDHIQNIDHILIDWESDYKNKDLTYSLMRSAHSLKGSANTVGFPEMGIIAHRMEDLIELVQQGKLHVSIKLVDLLFEGLDAMKVLLKWIDGEEMDAAVLAEEIVKKLDKVLSSSLSLVDEDPVDEKDSEPLKTEPGLVDKDEAKPIEEETYKKGTAEKPITDSFSTYEAPVITDEYDTFGYTPTGSFQTISDEDAATAKSESRISRISTGETEKQTVRVHINQLDLLMNLIGELVINRSKMDKRVDDFRQVGDELDFSRNRLLEAVEGFTEKHEFTLPDRSSIEEEGIEDFSALEFDKYDDFNILSRSLMEIGSDVVEIMNEIRDFLTSFNVEIHDMGQVVSRLQEEITRSRMVPVGRLFRRFPRTVRDISNRENKNVQLMIMGEDTELDKTVIEEMSDPLMHLVRNAVSHGVETPQKRVSLGKNKQGTVLLNAYPQGNTIIIEVEDDGKGLDINAIKESSIEKGLLTEEAAGSITQNQLIDFIFTPGFTTTKSTTEISGRGVGLDVVRQNILNLGGSISVQTEKNIGTRFIIKLPLTLAITQALLIESSGVQFALPLNAVDETVVLDTVKFGSLKERDSIQIRDKTVPFLKLNEILHLPTDTNGRRFMPAVLLGSADSNVALLVDDLLGQEEIVVKRLGSFLDKIRYFSGATISGDGKVVLILDPTYLVGFDEFAISATSTMESTLRERISVEKETTPSKPDVDKQSLLLVDDSISIRKFVGKLLENAGYHVDVAIDGLEALTKVESNKYHLIITDLEMPRMHGYEFITELKNSDKLKQIPVIVLTSRAGEKHKQKAMSKGADGYIVKPFNEEILLENIGRFI